MSTSTLFTLTVGQSFRHGDDVYRFDYLAGQVARAIRIATRRGEHWVTAPPG